MRVTAGEALWDLLANPRRLLGAGLAMALGVGLFVATVSLGVTAEHQVSGAFDSLRATEVRVVGSRTSSIAWAPDDYSGRLSEVAGVITADRLRDLGEVTVSGSPDNLQDPYSAHLWAVDDGELATIGVTIRGAPLRATAEEITTPGVLVGARIAERLNVAPLDGIQAIWLDGTPHQVWGVIGESGTRPELLDSLVVLYRASGQPKAQTEEIAIKTLPGAGGYVAEAAPLALRPEAPGELTAIAPPDPRLFRASIEGDVRTALVAVAVVAIIVGAMAVTNAMTLNVATRTAEIGVRRAIGARRADIFLGVLVEAGLIGLVGGAIGASAGVLGASVASIMLDWNPVIVPAALISGVAGGTALSILSGVAPAWRAGSVEPAEALRAL